MRIRTRLLSLALVLLGAMVSLGADTKHWEVLTNCQYIAKAENDGDSFRVGSGTNEFLLRLYFVDAPETNLRYPERTREQSEYFGVTLDETMKGGRTARDLVRETLREPFTVWTRWSSGAGRGKELRYYGFVMTGTNALDEILVSKGLARLKGVRLKLPTGETASAHQNRLQELEAEAKKEKIGLWGRATEKKKETAPP